MCTKCNAAHSALHHMSVYYVDPLCSKHLESNRRDEHNAYLVSNTNFLILSCLQTQNEVYLFLDRTSPFCFKYMYIKKKSRITGLHYLVFHVKMAACSNYTYVATIRLEIEPSIRYHKIWYSKILGMRFLVYINVQ